MPDTIVSPLMDHARLNKLSELHGDSFFILDGNRFALNFKSLHAAFAAHYGEVRIGYSYKTNYTPQLCRLAHELGGYAEIVSEMEYAHAKRLGVPGERIIFNGPVKAEWALKEAVLTGATINIDNIRDVGIIQAIAVANRDRDFAVVIRSNFSIGVDISRFGMDVNGAEFAQALQVIAQTPNLQLSGLHCHFPDRDLESFKRRAHGMVELVRKVFPGDPPKTLNIGGGYFGHMPESLRAKFNVPLATFEDYGKAVGEILTKAFNGMRKPVLFLEPGTAIVADAQCFYTRIVSVKEVMGKHFATVAGSSFDISPMARSRNLPVTPILADPRNGAVSYDIVGFTCIEKDILTEGLVAPLKPGDFLCYQNVGSYSVVMRPPFILPANPVLFDAGTGTLSLVKKRQSNEGVFHDFIY